MELSYVYPAADYGLQFFHKTVKTALMLSPKNYNKAVVLTVVLPHQVRHYQRLILPPTESAKIEFEGTFSPYLDSDAYVNHAIDVVTKDLTFNCPSRFVLVLGTFTCANFLSRLSIPYNFDPYSGDIDVSEVSFPNIFEVTQRRLINGRLPFISIRMSPTQNKSVFHLYPTLDTTLLSEEFYRIASMFLNIVDAGDEDVLTGLNQ